MHVADGLPLGAMQVDALEVSRLRILSSVRLSAAQGLNVLYGPNGSGKTSVLEAIHLLGYGRSFRSRQVREIIQQGERELLVGAVVSGPDGEWRLGVSHGSTGLSIRCNGETVRAASSLARLVPMVLISPDSQRLLTDGRKLRRELIDWILFHVEPSYLSVFLRFRKALSQRNAALRSGSANRAVESWNAELSTAGEALHALRSTHLSAMLPTVREFLASLLSVPVSVAYEPGWATETSLALALTQSLRGDRQRGHTERGPHRADLGFRVDGSPARRVLSRGEAKLFVVGLLLAQVHLLAELTGRTPVVLFDELASELDIDAQGRVFAALRKLGAQTFVTSVSRDLVELAQWPAGAVFHVERGSVSPVV